MTKSVVMNRTANALASPQSQRRTLSQMRNQRLGSRGSNATQQWYSSSALRPTQVKCSDHATMTTAAFKFNGDGPDLVGSSSKPNYTQDNWSIYEVFKSHEWPHKIIFTLLCSMLLTSAAVMRGFVYTPWPDVFVYCVVYSFWVTNCLPWLLIQMDGKTLGLLAGTIVRLFAADIGVLGWAAFRGESHILHRGLRLKAVMEPSLSWLSDAGYCLRFGVVVACVTASLAKVAVEMTIPKTKVRLQQTSPPPSHRDKDDVNLYSPPKPFSKTAANESRKEPPVVDAEPTEDVDVDQKRCKQLQKPWSDGITFDSKSKPKPNYYHSEKDLSKHQGSPGKPKQQVTPQEKELSSPESSFRVPRRRISPGKMDKMRGVTAGRMGSRSTSYDDHVSCHNLNLESEYDAEKMNFTNYENAVGSGGGGGRDGYSFNRRRRGSIVSQLDKLRGIQHDQLHHQPREENGDLWNVRQSSLRTESLTSSRGARMRGMMNRGNMRGDGRR